MQKPLVKSLALAFVVLAHFQSALAKDVEKEVKDLNFKKTNIAQDVFAAKSVGDASFYIQEMPYLEWKAKAFGQFTSMDVAPILRGRATGGVALPTPQQGLDPDKYEDQQADFVESVMMRNKGGRQKYEASDANTGLSDDKALANDERNTYIVQGVMSTVVSRPVTTIKMSNEKFVELTKNVDNAHSHYVVAGSLAIDALEENHIAGRTIKPNQAYLLSAIDFRTYQCQALQGFISDQFAKRPEKQRLFKDSIYLISDLQVNQPADIESVQKYLGKKPDIVMTQTILHADHLLRGGKTVFAFFGEGDKTRLVLISNIGLQKKYMAGSQSADAARYVVMNGIEGSAKGAAADVAIGLKKAWKEGDLSAATSRVSADILKKNKCKKGLALGLIRYAQVMLSRFADTITTEK